MKMKKKKLSFIESIFSFVFGDGDPNSNLEEKRWQVIASYIRFKEGSVIAEQIAPYLDDCLLSENVKEKYRHEEYMLHVVKQLNGIPKPSEDGQLIYIFPELQVTTTETQQNADTLLQLTPPIMEELWQFTKASRKQISWAFILLFMNIADVVILSKLLTRLSETLLDSFIYNLMYMLQQILFVFALIFLIFPLIRSLIIKYKNFRIESRNKQRVDKVKQILQGLLALRDKINLAANERALINV